MHQVYNVKCVNVCSAGDLILNPKEHLNVKLNDVVEIYHPEEDGCRLLLQVTVNGFNEELKGRGTITLKEPNYK